MDDKEIFGEKRDRSGGIPGRSFWVNKFELLEERIKDINKDILSTRNCIDFIMKDINVASERISQQFQANQRRLNLIAEMNAKLAVLCDERDNIGNEMLSLLPRDTFFKEDINVINNEKHVNFKDDVEILNKV